MIHFTEHRANIHNSKAFDLVLAAERCSRTPATIGQIMTFLGEPEYQYYSATPINRATDAISALLESGGLVRVGWSAGYALYSV